MSGKKYADRKHILLQTNLIICLIIAAGFALTTILSYRASFNESIGNIEQVSDLTAEGIYNKISGTFSKPINASLSMANDLFTKEYLLKEGIAMSNQADDELYIAKMKTYLGIYRDQIGCESVFLVSDASKRYYNFNGLDRVLTAGQKEDEWYFNLRTLDRKFNLVIDNDQVDGAKDEITVFINARILDADGRFLGTVGVGLVVDHFQTLIQEYENKFNVKIALLNEDGSIALSSSHYGFGAEKIDYFTNGGYEDTVKEEILDWKNAGEARELWLGNEMSEKENFIVTRYFPELKWHLVVERDTAAITEELNTKLIWFVFLIVGIIGSILAVITFVIIRFNKRIVALTKLTEEQRKTEFEEAAGHLFENIYELDVTGNRAGNRVTEEYFESLGVPKNTPFDQSLVIVANKQIKEEYRSGYIATFSPENVLKVFSEGQDSLSYEFMIIGEDGEYHWMRIVVQIVRRESDGGVHMYSYRQNIDAEKKREQKMRLLAQTDEMTGFLNKSETEKRIDEILSYDHDKQFAFYIFDIDWFKTANDRYGHAFGDTVITEFTSIIRKHFRHNDLMGRIGGDEFVVFFPYCDIAGLREKAAGLSAALSCVHEQDGHVWEMSASIGIALAPQDGNTFSTLYQKADAALYRTKARGRNSFTFFGDE